MDNLRIIYHNGHRTGGSTIYSRLAEGWLLILNEDEQDELVFLADCAEVTELRASRSAARMGQDEDLLAIAREEGWTGGYPVGYPNEPDSLTKLREAFERPRYEGSAY
jgi:hypothetical protein